MRWSVQAAAVLAWASAFTPTKQQLQGGPRRRSEVAAEVGRRLEAWCDANGVTRSCCVGETGGVRGLVATRALGPGEVCLRVPVAICCVEVDDDPARHWAVGMASTVAGRLAGDDNGDDDGGGGGGDDDPFAAALPEAPEALGRWDDDELAELYNTTLEVAAASIFFWRYEQLDAYRNARGDDDGGEDDELFLRALDVCCSRTLRIGAVLFLVPLLDMANHAAPADGGGTYAYDHVKDEIVLHAGPRGVAAGREVTMSYGDRPVEDFLLHYGFVPDLAHASADSATLLDGSSVAWADLPLDADKADEARRTLRNQPTTLEADLEDLQDGIRRKIPVRRRLALEYRVTKKRLLAAAAASSSG